MNVSSVPRKTALIVAGGIAAAGVSVPVLAGTAFADTERHGSCSQGKARYDFDVDKDDGRFEVDLEVDSNRRGQKWRLRLFHDGERVFSDVRTTDREGEAEYERNRPNTVGRDTFRARARNLGNGEVCSVRIVRR